MDIQLILVIILTILSLALISVCGYVILVLKEARQTVKHVNTFLESAQHIKSNFLAPAGVVLNIVSAIKDLVKTLRSVRTIADTDEE